MRKRRFWHLDFYACFPLLWLESNCESSANRKNRRRELRVFFSWAVRKKLVKENPVDATPTISVDRGKRSWHRKLLRNSGKFFRRMIIENPVENEWKCIKKMYLFWAGSLYRIYCTLNEKHHLHSSTGQAGKCAR